MLSPVFIVGCPRSGTTLLRDLLRSHPALTFPGESHFVPRFYRAYGDPKSDSEACRLAERILNVGWVRRWKLKLAPEHFRSCRSYRQIIEVLYGEWARQEGKPRWGDKTPHYVTDIRVLFAIFPDAKFIHIFRDGRDVALSWVKRKLEPRNLYVAGQWWQARVAAGRSAGQSLPPGSYLEVRFETLLDRPRETMKTVCSFIGEPFCEKVLQPKPLPMDLNVPGKSISMTEVVHANRGKWRKAMSARERALFESAAGEMLETLGYDIEGRGGCISLAERLFWKGHHWFLYWASRLLNARKRHLVATFIEFKWAELRSRLSNNIAR